MRNRRGVASPREEEEEEEDGAGDDWPGRRSAVYCAGALPGTYVGTRELDAGAAARIANSCACAVDSPTIELLMGEATREESAARCRRSDIRSRQHVAATCRGDLLSRSTDCRLCSPETSLLLLYYTLLDPVVCNCQTSKTVNEWCGIVLSFIGSKAQGQ